MTDEEIVQPLRDYWTHGEVLAALAAARADERERFVRLIEQSEGDMDFLKFLLEREANG